jgi:hypothetical protein
MCICMVFLSLCAYQSMYARAELGMVNGAGVLKKKQAQTEGGQHESGHPRGAKREQLRNR